MDDVRQALRPHATIRDPVEWTDVGGLLMPVERLRALENEIAAGAVRSVGALRRSSPRSPASYAEDEWAYVCAAFAQEHGFAPAAMSREQARGVLAEYDEAAGARQASVLDDSKKEFAAFARIGYGLGMTEEERMADFTAVRGSVDTNSVVQKLVQEQAAWRHDRSASRSFWPDCERRLSAEGGAYFGVTRHGNCPLVTEQVHQQAVIQDRLEWPPDAVHAHPAANRPDAVTVVHVPIHMTGVQRLDGLAVRKCHPKMATRSGRSRSLLVTTTSFLMPATNAPRPVPASCSSMMR